MSRHEITNAYFEWLYEWVSKDRHHKDISYRKLLTYLHDTEFVWSIPKDENRADNGKSLRYRFTFTEYGDRYVESIIQDIGDRPCSIFEMMVALSLECEENIMDNPSYGNRTRQWFWEMINSLGLGGMTDEMFDISYVNYVVERFLNRDYEPNGKGGLFTIRDCDVDLRDVEIYYQLCWYLDSIT